MACHESPFPNTPPPPPPSFKGLERPLPRAQRFFTLPCHPEVVCQGKEEVEYRQQLALMLVWKQLSYRTTEITLGQYSSCPVNGDRLGMNAVLLVCGPLGEWVSAVATMPRSHPCFMHS